MPTYYRVMLGKQSVHAAACVAGNFIGADYGVTIDLSDRLSQSPEEFRAQLVPVYRVNRPDKSRAAAGLACGALWTIGRGMAVGDIVLCPDGGGRYHVGEVAGPYTYVAGGPLPHRRPVNWRSALIDRAAMTVGLRNSTGSTLTVCNISNAGHADEVAALVGGGSPAANTAGDPPVADPAAFVMEKHLEDFLVQNWASTELGADFDLYEEDGELVGQQYPTDTGPLDLLAVSKDRKTLLVVELKKGKASDAVVGQTLRYMGFVRDELAAEGQAVAGVIIALEDDQRIRRALSVVPGVAFYRYQISFKLVKS